MAFCKSCGKELAAGGAFCQGCGAKVSEEVMPPPQAQGASYAQSGASAGVSDKDWLTTVLLSFFFGCIGVDHFYVGKIGTGIIKLLTLGGCGIWALIDFILIVCGSFRDANGLLIKQK